jgi:hypothetical protein
LLQRIFRGLHVPEIACGTGYWTEHIGATAASIVATIQAPFKQQLVKIVKTINFNRFHKPTA